MAIKHALRSDWSARLRARAHAPVPAEEMARRREETKHVLAARDRQPSIAPDTTGGYVHEIRDEASGS